MPFRFGRGIAEMLDAVSDENRLIGFALLSEDVPVRDLGDRLDVSRSTVQNYVDGYRQADLIRKTSDGFEVTEKGEVLIEWLEQLNGSYADFLTAQFRDDIVESGTSLEEVEGLDEIIEQLAESVETPGRNLEAEEKVREAVEELDLEEYPPHEIK